MITKHILKFRTIDMADFNEVRAGLKVIETRAATKRYLKIKKGDVLVFKCGKKKLEKQIKTIKHFSSIRAMLKQIPMKKIMPGVWSVFEMRTAYYSYPNYKEKIKKFGIVAFYI